MTLFPRKTLDRNDTHSRDRAKAHRILDQAKAGHSIEKWQIEWALVQTGDGLDVIPVPKGPTDDRRWSDYVRK